MSFNKQVSTSASPKLESSTFQIPKLNKLESPTIKKDKPGYPSKSPSPSTSPKHSFSKSPHPKITERFITDPSSISAKRTEERKKSKEVDPLLGVESTGGQTQMTYGHSKQPQPALHR